MPFRGCVSGGVRAPVVHPAHPPTYDAIKVPQRPSDWIESVMDRPGINHPLRWGPTYLHQLTWQWVCVVRNYCYDGPSPFGSQYCSCGLYVGPPRLGCAKSVVKLRARLGIQWIVDLSGPSSHHHHHLSFWNVSHAITVLSWPPSPPLHWKCCLQLSKESAKRARGA